MKEKIKYDENNLELINSYNKIKEYLEYLEKKIIIEVEDDQNEDK